jgi:hypothetical protein
MFENNIHTLIKEYFIAFEHLEFIVGLLLDLISVVVSQEIGRPEERERDG